MRSASGSLESQPQKAGAESRGSRQAPLPTWQRTVAMPESIMLCSALMSSPSGRGKSASLLPSEASCALDVASE